MGKEGYCLGGGSVEEGEIVQVESIRDIQISLCVDI